MSHEIEITPTLREDIDKAKERFKILFAEETEEPTHTKEALLWEVLDFIEDSMVIGFLCGKGAGIEDAQKILREPVAVPESDADISKTTL